MSDDLRRSIYSNLSQKETDELVKIWQKNNQAEWSTEAFGVIREILLQRIGDLPPQGEPVYDLEELEEEEDDEDDIHPLLAKFVDEDNAPVFYDPREVLWLEKWLKRIAVISIPLIVLSNLKYVPSLYQFMLSNFSQESGLNFTAAMLTFIFGVPFIALSCFLVYFILRALASILKILMEWEFNSRGVK